MAGEIRRTIDRIIEIRSKGNETLKSTTMTKLLLAGININSYNAVSPDDPAVLSKLKSLADTMGITL